LLFVGVFGEGIPHRGPRFMVGAFALLFLKDPKDEKATGDK
jgi:hypothetical protein